MAHPLFSLKINECDDSETDIHLVKVMVNDCRLEHLFFYFKNIFEQMSSKMMDYSFLIYFYQRCFSSAVTTELVLVLRFLSFFLLMSSSIVNGLLISKDIQICKRYMKRPLETMDNLKFILAISCHHRCSGKKCYVAFPGPKKIDRLTWKYKWNLNYDSHCNMQNSESIKKRVHKIPSNYWHCKHCDIENDDKE